METTAYADDLIASVITAFIMLFFFSLTSDPSGRSGPNADYQGDAFS